MRKKQMRRTMAFALAGALLAGSLQGLNAESQAEAAESSVQQEFYVDVNGADSNDGSREHPFATVERARQAVDAVNDDMTGDIIVNIGAGDYYLEDTIVFGPEDSGTNGYEVIYKSYEGISAANLIGGERITGWTLADQTDVDEYDLDASLLGKVYKVQLDPEEYEFNTLYVNDERAVMARTRNRDNQENFPMAKGEYMRSTGGNNSNLNMYYNAADFQDEIGQKAIAGMVHAQERGEEEIAQVFVWDGGDWDWFTNTVPVASIDTVNSELKFPAAPEDYPEKYRTKYDIGVGARYFLQGNLAFMDVEGEYHYNKTTGILYYYPKAEDGAIEEQTIIVPTMQKVLYFKGADKENLADEPDPDAQVHNITLDGLGIKDTEFAAYFTYSWNWGDASGGIGYYPEAAEGSTNPSYCESVDREEFRVGSITLDGTHDITITNTRVKNSGLYGIIYAGDNQHNLLKNSVIENTGYGGLIFEGGYPAIGKYNNHNTVENVLIHGVGDLVGHAVGLTVMSSGQNTFTNLEVYDTPKRAILLLGGFRRNGTADANYDEIRDMYTVGNHFTYVYVHDAQQDAGEDSAVFLSWLLAGRDVNRLHGSKDPNDLQTNLEGVDLNVDRYNYFEQTLITDVGADPSVIEKCTSGCLDTAMGVSGSQFYNVRAMNGQSHLLAIRTQTEGDGYGDIYGVENTTHNLYTNDTLREFDDGAMEYEKIGLTDAFPSELRAEKRVYQEAPEDVWFSDDFEADVQTEPLDTTKWTVEKGTIDMSLGFGYASEDPLDPDTIKRSLPIDADINTNGVVVSRTFNEQLNKIVQVEYFDLRKDYASADAYTAVPTTITPNSFLRVDDGENALGIGAVGEFSKDYYVIKKGDELILTDVQRVFGWHTFKFDYSSGTDVKLYIDEQLIAVYDEEDTDVAKSFDYIGMGDWEGRGGKAYFDQLYVYGGQQAQNPPGELEQAAPPADEEEILFDEDFEGEEKTEFATNKGNAVIEYTADPLDSENTVMHVTSVDDLVYYKDGIDWANYTLECKLFVNDWGLAGATSQVWDNVAPVWNAGSQDEKGNWNRYSLKYKGVTKEFALYSRRPGSDNDMVSAEAPEEFEGTWHDYKITTANGVITAYVDGEKIFEYTDTSNPSGTIGFDGINVDYYVDDIRVTTLQTAAPAADVAAGTYDQPQTVHLTAEGADIYYTLDGSDPIENGILYNAASGIEISGNVTLKCVAKASGMRYSQVAEFIYSTPSAFSRENLQALYDENKDRADDGYSQLSWERFQTALDGAKDVLDNPDAAQSAIETAIQDLRNAVSQLTKGAVIKGWLSTLYYENRNREQEYYTEESWNLFQEALAGAKATLEAADTSQAAVDAAMEELQSAIDALEFGEGPTPPETLDAQFFWEDFEGETTTEWTKGGNKNIEGTVVGDPDDPDNHVLYVDSEDGVLYFNDPDAAELENYIYEFKMRLADWDGSNAEWLSWAYMAPSFCLVPGEATAMGRYALKYDRSSGNFILFNGSTNLNIVSQEAPADFDPLQWHTFRIELEDGTISLYVDDGEEPVFQYTDQNITGGTFGFEGINAEYYVDDIRVTLRSTSAPAADKSSGVYEEPFEVALSVEETGADIFYTLDGSDPKENGVYYFEGQPLKIEKSCTLKAVAIAEGKCYSEIVEYKYQLGDKSTLAALIDQAEGMKKEQDRYVAADWPKLEEALVKAYAVMENDAAKQEDIALAEETLFAAMQAQKLKADKTRLEELIQEAEAAETEGCTVESIETLEEALENAYAIQRDDTLSEDDQTRVDDVVKALEEAIDGLAEAAPGGDDGQDDGSQGGQDDGQQGGQGGNDGDQGGQSGNDGGQGGNNGDQGGQGGNDGGQSGNAPGKTGDGAPVFIWIVAALLALCIGATAVLQDKRMRRG